MTILDKILREKRLEVEVLLAEEKVEVNSENNPPFFIPTIIQS